MSFAKVLPLKAMMQMCCNNVWTLLGLRDFRGVDVTQTFRQRPRFQSSEAKEYKIPVEELEKGDYRWGREGKNWRESHEIEE